MAGQPGQVWSFSAGLEARLYGRQDARRHKPKASVKLRPPNAFIRAIFLQFGCRHCI
jgi:hypothetical protein